MKCEKSEVSFQIVFIDLQTSHVPNELPVFKISNHNSIIDPIVILLLLNNSYHQTDYESFVLAFDQNCRSKSSL